MNSEILILLWIGIVTFVLSVVYFLNPMFFKKIIGENDPFEKKIFRGNFPSWQFIMLTIVYPVVSLFVISLWFTIMRRPEIEIYPLGEKGSMILLFLLFIMISYGVGTHAASVSISHYMLKLKITRAFEVVEFYHHLVSHFLTIIPGILVWNVFSVFEINHPLVMPLELYEMLVIIFSSILTGTVFGLIIIEGRGKYYSIPAIILSIVFLFYYIFDLGLSLYDYPVMLFSLTIFIVMFLTLLIWRILKGEIHETIGEFFHTND